jgi:DNA-binding XRE family transcriptional regulator
MPFTQNFNYCMEQKKYTAYKFAKIIGASNQGVLNWQSGECTPYPKTKKKIADHFGITLAELDGDELPVLPEDGAKKAPATEGEGEKDALIKAVREITDKDTALAVFDELSKKMRELM